jgi:hypothetical protein
MALHVTPVACPSLGELAAPVRRPATGGTTARQPVPQAGTATLEPQADSSFRSVLARSSVAERPVAAAATATENQSAAVANSATSPSTNRASGLSEVQQLFAGRSYSPAAATVGNAASPSTSSASATAAASSSSTSTASASNLSDFELTFGGPSYNPADPLAAARAASASSASAAGAAVPPTAQSVFGPDVWMTDPIGLNPDGTTFEYNPFYFATESTAQTVAQMVGGTVVAKDIFTQPAGDPFVQQQPNYMVPMPNGALINPGLVASFYTFGFPQSQIDTMIAQEVANTPPPAQTA